MLSDSELSTIRSVNGGPKRPSMRWAIDLKCKDCIYDPLAGGTWRQQVEECTAKDCPLWGLRPKAYVPREAQDLAK